MIRCLFETICFKNVLNTETWVLFLQRKAKGKKKFKKGLNWPKLLELFIVQYWWYFNYQKTILILPAIARLIVALSLVDVLYSHAGDCQKGARSHSIRKAHHLS